MDFRAGRLPARANSTEDQFPALLIFIFGKALITIPILPWTGGSVLPPSFASNLI